MCSFAGAAGVAQSNGDYNRAIAEFGAGRYASAEALFARVEASSPGATDALLYRAKCLVHLPDFKSAEQALRRYLDSGHGSADALYMLGFVLNREDRPRESLAAYTRAAALTPPASDDLKIVGLDYILLDDYPDAIQWLEKAVAFDDKNKDAWYYLGRAYYSKSRLGEARRAFEKVLEFDPRNSKAE
ncbi:MAG: tetratricopeptide repeat protein, partial [Acidobacteria bacterium]|nr:tetratricopeptide repeat protein [Acidobacteriota bacterium]